MIVYFTTAEDIEKALTVALPLIAAQEQSFEVLLEQAKRGEPLLATEVGGVGGPVGGCIPYAENLPAERWYCLNHTLSPGTIWTDPNGSGVYRLVAQIFSMYWVKVR